MEGKISDRFFTFLFHEFLFFSLVEKQSEVLLRKVRKSERLNVSLLHALTRLWQHQSAQVVDQLKKFIVVRVVIERKDWNAI